MEDLELITLTVVLLIYCLKKRRQKCKKTRKCWTKPWLLRRMNHGAGYTLMKELALEEPTDFRNWIRMDPSTFKLLLSKVEPRIKRQETHIRESIPAEQRLALTLRYLAAGESQRSLSYCFRISPSAICEIIPETIDAIYDVLWEDHLSVPKTETEWKLIAKNFYDQWQFPQALGALDGKHIRILPPAGSGSEFYNYKGYHSIVLMDANYKFIFADCGTNGRISDRGVWSKCKLREAIEDGRLGIPSPDYLPGSQRKAPFVIVGDEGFTATNYLLRPYPGRNLGPEERIFNYRLRRARRIVENAFGILANRWRILLTAINLGSIDKMRKIVMTCVVLHNFLLNQKSAQNIYCPENLVDTEDDEGNIVQGTWRNDSSLASLSGINSRPPDSVKQIQSVFKDFFNNEGAVPWQYDIV